MRDWQVKRRKRTRHLIELGGLVVKSGVVELTGDDRAVIYGALLWMADKLQGEQGEQACSLWMAKGQGTFEEHHRPKEMNTNLPSDNEVGNLAPGPVRRA